MSSPIYVFKDADSIVTAMKTVSDIGSDIERVQRRFAQMMANSEKVPSGVVLGFMLAIHDVASVPGSVPFIDGMMMADFPDYMEAVLADAPEFLAEVLAVFEAVTNE